MSNIAYNKKALMIKSGLWAFQLLTLKLSTSFVLVLDEYDDGLSNAEIAQKLYLSPNTLKAHTQNIYSKLDVHSRLQATNKARELKIL